MSFLPTWQGRGGSNATGWFPIVSDTRAACLHCKGHLSKLHGLNRDGNGGLYEDQYGRHYVMAFFAFGTGPWCLHCAVKEAWTQKDFFRRPGSNEYSGRHFDLEATLRPRLPSIADELKRLG